MTDQEKPTPSGAETSEVQSKPTRSGAAAAASRARRIGGGVSASPRRPTPAPESEPAVVMKKVATREREVVGRGSGAATKAQRREISLPGWVAWIPAVVFAALAVAFVVLTLIDHVGGGSDVPGNKQRETVLAATKNCVAATNTYKYTNVDSYEQAGLKCATGVYKRQYRSAMESLIKKNAPGQKFTQIAQVNSAGIESVTRDGGQWSMLVYGQLNITNQTTGKQGRIDPFAVVATMQRDGGKWLIAKIKLLSTPTG